MQLRLVGAERQRALYGPEPMSRVGQMCRVVRRSGSRKGASRGDGEPENGGEGARGAEVGKMGGGR